MQADKQRLEAAAAELGSREAAVQQAEAELAERRWLLEVAEAAALQFPQQDGGAAAPQQQPQQQGTPAATGQDAGGTTTGQDADSGATPYEDATAGDQVTPQLACASSSSLQITGNSPPLLNLASWCILRDCSGPALE